MSWDLTVEAGHISVYFPDAERASYLTPDEADKWAARLTGAAKACRILQESSGSLDAMAIDAIGEQHGT